MQNYNHKKKTSLSIDKNIEYERDLAYYRIYGLTFQQCLCFFFSASLSLSPAERRGLQYEHPHARPPSEFLSGHSFPGPEGCWAAGEAHFRTWCGLLTNGYAGEPLAAYSDSCQQEEGKEGTVQYCKAF